jgi:hypothetical protein
VTPNIGVDPDAAKPFGKNAIQWETSLQYRASRSNCLHPPLPGNNLFCVFSNKERSVSMALKDIQKVLIIGSGTMGRQIAFQCAAHGYGVTLYDIDETALEKASRRLASYAENLITGGHLERRTAEEALAGIATTTDAVQAAADADLLSESVPEDPVLKGNVFARFNHLCPSRTIFTTNTSQLVPSSIAEATGRPDRFLAFHFHQPAWVGNVADIMPWFLYLSQPGVSGTGFSEGQGELTSRKGTTMLSAQGGVNP